MIRRRNRRLSDLESCRQALAELDLSAPFTIDDVHAAVERRLGVPIRVLRAPHLADSTSGLWLAYPDHHCIVIIGWQSPLGEAATRMHEYGHMVFGDQTPVVPDPPAEADFPDLDPDLVAAALRRSHFDERVERRAETFATLALAHTDLLAASSQPVGDADPEVLARLKETLERS